MPKSKSSKVKTSQTPNNNSNNRSLQELLHTLLTRLSDSSEVVKSWPESDGTDNSIHAETTTKLITSIQKVVDAIKLVEEKVNPGLGGTNNNDGGGGDATGGDATGGDATGGNVTDQQQQQEDKMSLAHKLRQTAVPLDLLDMMDADADNGLNPDCFARGLLNEALRQFMNLSKRKVSMSMLAKMVENGFEQRERELKLKAAEAAAASEAEGETKSINEGAVGGDDNVAKGANVKSELDEGLVSKKRKRESDDTATDVQTEPPAKR